MLQDEVVWGFFSALSCTFFLSEFKPDVICLPFLSAYVGFHMHSSLQGQILKQEGVGPDGSSILAKLIYHKDQSKRLLQDIFLGGSPASQELFSPLLVSGGADPFLFLFPCCGCAGYGQKPRILMELLCSFLCPVWYFPLLSHGFLFFFFLIFSSDIIISILLVPY